ncbi:ester cyclase [Conexibacter sp. SYSU D00693]|uniref:ester cyclase n=1 Tax=Conexibacter sp. SYSU D00693 TaxID=2812560 RepID=UPI00196B93D1|nr:nuclear transport factor 2 family protein [Conexibacter sp. SYSU D00693]
MATTAAPVDLDRVSRWYQGWLDAWNAHDPDRIRPLVTDDFLLTTPTSAVNGWEVRGVEEACRYVAFVVGAYPDLVWEQTGPALLAPDVPRAAFTWRGTGTFSGRMDPPGIEGTGKPFAFTGVEVFDFRDDRACALDVAYDLQGLMRQVLPRRRSA